MRGVLDFYRRRPVVGVLVALLGLGLALATAAVGADDKPVLAVVLAVLFGLLVGAAISAAQDPEKR
ncbi:hypothetical protein [Conexibacter sp. SYSU D00693]|uniref:hypothetical protein n=1 Tax=Conexibacter sp. SYSU D00693 TaxID=2812560 RepID=UPI00196B1861|nr:hypothetical protein [Conexibacter sp. SYSU D00693]